MDPVTNVSSVNVVSGSRGTPRLEQPRPIDETAVQQRKLRKASNDFESIFIAQLLKPMAESMSGKPGGQRLGGDVMLSVALERMAESIAQQGGVGLGNMLYESLKDRLLPDSAATEQRSGTPMPLAEPDSEAQRLNGQRWIDLTKE